MKFKKLVISILLIVVLILPSISACGSDEEAEPETNTGTVVYVTKTGEKYHRENCTYLSNSKIEISLEKAINKGYGRCSKCKPPKE